MSVSTSVQLPAQPSTGVTTQVVLGGDGFLGPQASQHVSLEVAADASGGSATLTIRFDVRYVCMVSGVIVEVDNAIADRIADINISDGACKQRVRLSAVNRAISGMATENVASWSPRPMAFSAGTGAVTDPPAIVTTLPNINTETYRVIANILLFNKQARERVPLETMSRALVRAESALTG